jgi:hypothetical protein
MTFHGTVVNTNCLRVFGFGRVDPARRGSVLIHNHHDSYHRESYFT